MVVVRRTLTAWTWLLAGCVAVALALGLLGVSRARVGDVTLLVPPLVFFAVGAVAARRLGSFARGLQVDSTSAAVLDTLHPVFIVLHLLFWLPGLVLGAQLGARAQPLDDPPRTA